MFKKALSKPLNNSYRWVIRLMDENVPPTMITQAGYTMYVYTYYIYMDIYVYILKLILDIER